MSICQTRKSSLLLSLLDISTTLGAVTLTSMVRRYLLTMLTRKKNPIKVQKFQRKYSLAKARSIGYSL